MKQFKCPRCIVESIEEEIRFFIDQQIIEKNKIIQFEYNDELDKYNHDKKVYDTSLEEYEDIVAEHNRTKHWWQWDWVIDEDRYGARICNSQWNKINQYPFILIPEEPTLDFELAHYILCPVCGYRHYFKPGGSNETPM